MAGYIGQINVNNESYKIGSTLYGICNTAAEEPVKDLIIDGFSYTDGVTVHIKFINAYTDLNTIPKLKIKSSANDNSAIAYDITNQNGSKTWIAGSVISFTLIPTTNSYEWAINSFQIDTSAIQIDVSQLSNLNLGYIQSNGTISQTNDTAIEDGDKLIISDVNSNPAGKISRSEITFDASTESQVLSKRGTWVDMYTHPTDAGNKHIPSGGSTGQFLQYGGSSGTASWASLTATDIPELSWNKITSDKPTTLSGYGIGDGLSTSATISIAGNSISLNNGTLSKETLRASLELSSPLRFIGRASEAMSESNTTAPTIVGRTDTYVPEIGDVVLDSDSDNEYLCIAVNNGSYTWELLGRDSNFAINDEVIHNSLLTTAGDIIIGQTSGSSVIPARLGVGNNTDGYVLTIDSTSHLPDWKPNAATDEKVEQAPYSTTVNSSTKFNLLFKYNTGDTTVTDKVYYSTLNNKQLTFDAYDGTLSAAKFSGDGSGLSGVSVNWDNVLEKIFAKLYVNNSSSGDTTNTTTTNTTTYIHLYDNNSLQGTIKLIGDDVVKVSSAGSKIIAITATSFTGADASNNGTAGYLAAPGIGNQNKFLQGSGSWKALSIPTIASVSGGVLTITNVALSVT